MPPLDQTKQRWKAELELEELRASPTYHLLLKNLLLEVQTGDLGRFKSKLEALEAKPDELESPRVAAWPQEHVAEYIRGAIVFKEQYADVGFDQV